MKIDYYDDKKEKAESHEYEIQVDGICNTEFGYNIFSISAMSYDRISALTELEQDLKAFKKASEKFIADATKLIEEERKELGK